MKHYQRSILIVLLGAAFLAGGAAQPQDRRVAAPAQDQRLAAPADLDCSRDDLTVFAGRVAEFTRNGKRLRITIETDWQTRETRTLRYANDQELLKRLRLDGKTFAASDWSKIESAGGRTPAKLRAKVWVCGQAPKQRIVRIDWEPAREQ